MKFISPHRDITISQKTNGAWMINVGCASLPYFDFKQMLKDIETYIKAPDKIEAEYNKATVRQQTEPPRLHFQAPTTYSGTYDIPPTYDEYR